MLFDFTRCPTVPPLQKLLPSLQSLQLCTGTFNQLTFFGWSALGSLQFTDHECRVVVGRAYLNVKFCSTGGRDQAHARQVLDGIVDPGVRARSLPSLRDRRFVSLSRHARARR